MRLIEVENVTKVYRPRRGSNTLLADTLPGLFRRLPKQQVVALDDVSFTVESGEAFGIIGANGSGKSTLLKLLSGVTIPTSGHIRVYGRVASLLELGAGFHPQLTGRENIYLNARILGMSNEHINSVFEQIVDFAGIRDFLDSPVSTYSSGMYVRLGFAVAAYADPDVFLVDEVLSVGDEEFQRKCRTRIGELREQGKTMVFVSHDLNIVNTLCTRVVLLSKGKMISRGTPRQTIDYYLRQIGREAGIHTFTCGEMEAIFCHGRISLFRGGQELTAAGGLQMVMHCLGQLHHSVGANWTVEERGADFCRVRGQMARLPVTLNWDLRLESERLVWKVSFQAEQDLEMNEIRLVGYWPLVYKTWFYGHISGKFPELAPQDLSWQMFPPRAPFCMEAGASPSAASHLPSLAVIGETAHPYVGMTWGNTDYVGGARVLDIAARMRTEDNLLPRGEHELATLEFRTEKSEEQAKAVVREHMSARVERENSQRTVTSGKLQAVFDGGNVRYAYDGTEVTSFLHFYSSAYMLSLWNDSHDLQWSAPRLSEGRLDVTGESRRFAYRQHWEIEAVEGGISTRIWLEAMEPLEMNEYHASVVLKEEYNRWETPFERGEYPDYEPGQNDWRHVNRVYEAGRFARALSSSLPPVMFSVNAGSLPFRMTAINTGDYQRGRVLQALRTPDSGLIRFEPGRHLYFEGKISVGDTAVAAHAHPHESQGSS